MLRTMGNFICLNNIIITILATLSFISCAPSEAKLELQFKKQAIEEVFTFADYCEETYDSIYIIQPYDDKDVICSLPYKISNKLRGKCSYTLDDTFVRILFIENDVVKAFTEIGNWSACFSTSEIVDNGAIFPFNQKFIIDENRYVHIYNE